MKKEIPLKEAHEILTSCAAVIVEGVPQYPAEDVLTGEPYNVFLMLGWSTGDVQNVEYFFLEKDNQIVAVDGSTMTLVARNGRSVELTILEKAKLS